MNILLPVLIGFLLDLLLGDPRGMPHVVRGLGRMIAWGEGALRRLFPKTPRGEYGAGLVLTLCVTLLPSICAGGALWLCLWINRYLYLAVAGVLCFQLLAARSLCEESMRVCRRLREGDLPGARAAVSMIVGRETETLDEAGVARAAVETVAENASDGVVAPLFFLLLGGAPLGLFYKAVNTLDSMIGYKNERYLYFGRFAAHLDDLCNFIPSRLCALLMVAAAFLLGLDGRGAYRIWRRDRRKHPSPNSAQTEAACAGALGVRLGGDSTYFGVVHHKSSLGDDTRPIGPQDIAAANRLMWGASALALILLGFWRLAL